MFETEGQIDTAVWGLDVPSSAGIFQRGSFALVLSAPPGARAQGGNCEPLPCALRSTLHDSEPQTLNPLASTDLRQPSLDSQFQPQRLVGVLLPALGERRRSARLIQRE